MKLALRPLCSIQWPIHNRAHEKWSGRWIKGWRVLGILGRRLHCSRNWLILNTWDCETKRSYTLAEFGFVNCGLKDAMFIFIKAEGFKKYRFILKWEFLVKEPFDSMHFVIKRNYNCYLFYDCKVTEMKPLRKPVKHRNIHTLPIIQFTLLIFFNILQFNTRSEIFINWNV